MKFIIGTLCISLSVFAYCIVLLGARDPRKPWWASDMLVANCHTLIIIGLSVVGLLTIGSALISWKATGSGIRDLLISAALLAATVAIEEFDLNRTETLQPMERREVEHGLYTIFQKSSLMVDMTILYTGLIIFLARILDVSIGTVRTIVTVQGRTVVAFFLAIVEISIWVTVASTVINQIKEQPMLVVFYAFGYATGNVVGIQVERKLAFGMVVLRVISKSAGKEIADALREIGQPVTVFMGEGMRGPVAELYIAARRRDIKWILPEVIARDPKAFYVIEAARDVRRVLKPTHTSFGGWRAIS